ncbi:MAG TPA: hypothetical protein CFH84_03800 [Sulfurimonas sp. UBA12504]|nr:MAG: hypothetical protein A2019_02985 [Sulfurimonas sp. GWF2_37_8]DAB30478.1 MAG TPA: hypothetical protein CFH84_03800 [Sulfurimonas sp. UBA12504]
MLFVSLLNLHATTFYNDAIQNKQEQKIEISKAFRESVNDANDIVKRGEYYKILKYKSDTLSIIEQLKLLNISQENRQTIHDDIVLYFELINNISSKLQEKAPKLQEHHKTVIESSHNIDKRIAAIGLSELSQNWYEINNIKNNFIRNPNEKLEEAFHTRLTAMTTIITELYLNEEQEKPLFQYLNGYENYFKELSAAYSSAEYKNLKKIKPLSYKIKAQLEFLAPYN